MKKFNTSPISGAQELTPALQAQFDNLKTGIARAFRAHGFQHVETPVIERTEVLLAKAGGETEKQIYKIVKTNETSAEADQALRFDHTVSLARYTVEHLNDLAFPFKATQVARNFRGERAQTKRGRFREFYQCDVDVVGRGELALAYDAEVIATLAEAMRVLPLPGFVVRVSNRKLLGGFLAELNLEHLSAEIFAIVDHAEKVAPAATAAALAELGVGEENAARVMEFIEIRGGREEVKAKLEKFGFENAMFNEGISEIDEVLGTAAELDPNMKIVADMKIVRGLDYYTGTVFETIVPEFLEFGSICSGGRYENLAENYTDQKLPGVGGSIGLTRLFALLADAGLIRTDEKAVEVCVVPVSKAEIGYANAVAAELRAAGKTVDLVLGDRRLGDKLKYAARVAKEVAVIGEDEAKNGAWELRELR